MCAAAAAGAGGILSSSHSMGLGVRVIPGAGNDFGAIGSGMGPCPVMGARSDCRSRYQLLLSGRALAERYRRIYTTAINDKEQGLNLGRWVPFNRSVRVENPHPDSVRLNGVGKQNNLDPLGSNVSSFEPKQ